MAEANAAATGAVPKKRSRYVDMGLLAQGIKVFSATDSSSEDDVPLPPRARKPRKSKAAKKYTEQPDSGEAEDFQAGSSDEWQPEKKAEPRAEIDVELSKRQKKRRKTIKKKSGPSLEATTVTSTARKAQEPDKKEEDGKQFGAIPKYSRAEGRPFKWFNDEPGAVFKISEERARINDKILDVLLKLDALKGRNVGTGPIPEVGPSLRLPVSETSLKPLLELAELPPPPTKPGEKPKAKDVTVSLISEFMKILDPSLRKCGWKNRKMVRQLRKEYDKIHKEVTSSSAGGKSEKFEITEELLESMGFGDCPLLIDDDEDFSWADLESILSGKPVASTSSAEDGKKLTANDFKPSALDKLVGSFFNFVIDGKSNQDSPESVAEWLKKGPILYERDSSKPGLVHTVTEDGKKKEKYTGIKVREDGTGIDFYALCDKEILPDKLMFLSFDKVDAPSENASVAEAGKSDCAGGSVTGKNHGGAGGSYEDKKYKCVKCEYCTAFKDNLTRHTAAKHGTNQDKVHKCQQCDYASVRSGQLLSHMRHRHGTDEEKVHKCTQCDYASVESGDLRKHTRHRHGTVEDKVYKCTQCDYASVQSSQLRTHMGHRHGTDEDKVHKCTQCDYASVQSGDLRTHMRHRHGTDEDKVHKCTQCDYASINRGHLQRHMRHRHGTDEDKVHKCTQCDYASVQSGDLRTHMRHRHGTDEDKVHKCTQCDYASINRGHLQRHMRHRHGTDEDKVHKCTQCDYASVRSCQLRTHMRYRHGTDEDKVHKCTQCDYASVESGDLRRHMRHRHGTDEDKVHKCTQCDYATVRKGQLLSHKCRIHGN